MEFTKDEVKVMIIALRHLPPTREESKETGAAIESAREKLYLLLKQST